MLKVPMEVYLDYSLRKKTDTIVINANQIRSQQSDINVFFITNSFKPDSNGNIKTTKLTTTKTFFIKFIDETGEINFRMIQSAHFANIIQSDFDVMEFYPDNPEEYSNYNEKHPVPSEGGWLYYAYCPFGENHIELLNGDIIKTCGGIGRAWITSEQIGFKGYKKVPKIDSLFEMGPYKILKLVLHTKWEPYSPQRYNISLFAPDIKEETDAEYKIPNIDDTVLVYCRADKIEYTEHGSRLINLVNNDKIVFNAELKDNSPIETIKKHLLFDSSSYISLDKYSSQIKKEFTFHMNFALNSYARGTVLFEGAYGVDGHGNQTHHITVFVNKAGELCYNTKYNDEYINTKTKIPLKVYTTLTFIISDVKIDIEDKSDYATFIFLNGKQIYPEAKYLTQEEIDILFRGYKAYKVYNEVCLGMEYNPTTMGAIDPKAICAKKLLKESGFVSMDILNQVYGLYLKRPHSGKGDIASEFEIGDDDKTTIKIFNVGQDSYGDLTDKEYYFDGEIYEFALFNTAIDRDLLEIISLNNSLGYHSLNVKEENE